MAPNSLLAALRLAALVSLALVPIARANQAPLSLDVPVPDSCSDSCDALGCSASDPPATPSIVPGSTTIYAPASGSPPYSPPSGLEGATQAGSFVGSDGVTTVQWKLVQPSTIYVPGSAPTEPPCASWTVTSVPKTVVVNGVTIVRDEPVLTAVGREPVTSYIATTSVSTTTIPGGGQQVTATEYITTTSISTSTFIPPPTTIVETTTSTLSLPPVTETSVSVSTFTSTLERPTTLWSTTTSYSTLTELSISTSTTTSTSISIPPPITTTSTSFSTLTSTETAWSTTTSVFVQELTTTLVSTAISYSTLTEHSTSTSTVTSTTTSVPPPVTTTSVSVSTATSTETAWSTSTSVSLSTITSLSTTSVSYCPPQPTTSTPPLPPCVPGVTTAWRNVDIYKNQPFSLTWNDPYPALLKVQDAGYKSEKYSITVNGAQIGTTSDITVDRGAWCGLSPNAQKTCYAQGMSSGQFVIPAAQGGSSQAVGIVNVPGVSGDSYSTVFYQLERQCPNQYVPPAPVCSADLQQGWTNVDVYEGRNYNLATFNYNYPVKLSVVDAGYKTEQYYVILDGTQIGWTHTYTSNWGVWCGITADQAQNCLNQGLSSGVFVIPAGSHSVAFSSISTRNPAWAAYSTMFYKVEKYCE